MNDNLEKGDFNLIVNKTISELEQEYLQFVEQASDKQYAKDYFITHFFLYNPELPLKSYFFRLLLLEFAHQLRISPTKALLTTFQNIDLIKENVKESYLETGYFGDFSEVMFHESRIPSLMLRHMKTYNIMLEDLHSLDQEILKQDDQFFMDKLVLYFSCKRLKLKYSETESIPTIEQKSKFTRNEQILAMFFLLKSLGVNILGQADRTKMAALFHLIMGIDFQDSVQIKNLSIYKNLSKLPQVVQSKKQLLSYLQNIRAYFHDANFLKAVELIDREINLCKENSK